MQYLARIIAYKYGNTLIQNLTIDIVKYTGKEICSIDVSPYKNPDFISHSGMKK
jgi:hypothetical protein